MLDPDDDEIKQSELKRFVTRNLGRVLFLWFIQAKGWLDDDPSYLMNLYGRTVADGRLFFADALVPLFFDTLAVEKERRTGRAARLGDVPYLNGGLFVPTVDEDHLYGEAREHIEIVVPNELFDPREHDRDSPTVLGLLKSYRFTTQESTPDDLSVDPDPELLARSSRTSTRSARRPARSTRLVKPFVSCVEKPSMAILWTRPAWTMRRSRPCVLKPLIPSPPTCGCLRSVAAGCKKHCSR